MCESRRAASRRRSGPSPPARAATLSRRLVSTVAALAGWRLAGPRSLAAGQGNAERERGRGERDRREDEPAARAPRAARGAAPSRPRGGLARVTAAPPPVAGAHGRLRGHQAAQLGVHPGRGAAVGTCRGPGRPGRARRSSFLQGGHRRERGAALVGQCGVQAAARAVQAHGGGAAGAAERGGRLGERQPLPGDEQDELAVVVGAAWRARGRGRRAGRRPRRGRARRSRRARRRARPAPSRRAPPRRWLASTLRATPYSHGSGSRGSVLAAPPGDEEHLGVRSSWSAAARRRR